tara:strand:- start:87 stop:485 length:399 start_codon:yes stop_codon:yes gene_type:complete
MKEIEFWFSIGSTYTYLSVSRLKEVERKFEVSFSWQPFSVRKIMREMDNVPFPPTKQAKVDYMWRDIQRRARGYGFEARIPAPYPLKEFDLANRIAVLGIHSSLKIITCSQKEQSLINLPKVPLLFSLNRGT